MDTLEDRMFRQSLVPRGADDRPRVGLTEHLGTEGARFARVGLAFRALGFAPPTPDADSQGAYVSNIIGQYRADLSEAEVKDVIAFGLSRGVGELEAWVADRDTPDGLTMDDVRGYSAS